MHRAVDPINEIEKLRRPAMCTKLKCLQQCVLSHKSRKNFLPISSHLVEGMRS